ncbi:putative amidohydrolase [Spinactinospora alkalitolerans]|uniref:Putative amidohydrolase n=1 Tax=Spinactinospora alkalitolerans TaxID=687207 RepID=A0A852TVD0_9ACTN|nr:carbon-nitrogen hydrolase family protein [Spinactinospora alkalitolerans]NYE48436.1 putative amidohydrolase [Spinactinospora alkalitolerans]
MSAWLPVTVVQDPPIPAAGDPDLFAAQARDAMRRFPRTRLLVYPELHLYADPDPDPDPGSGAAAAGRPAAPERLAGLAEPLDGPLATALAATAAELGVWLLPGTLCEPDGRGGVYNTSVLFSPEGRIAGAYRKCFPWRPYETFTPGSGFTVVDVPEWGRIGLSICYDTWFPEVARQLAAMGADLIVTPAQTTTADREQELVMTRAAAIANQVFVVNANAAGPIGAGRSLVADPEGRVRTQAQDGPAVLTDVLDADEVARVREHGTAGLNRIWHQFTDEDAPLDLPFYRGRIDPADWSAVARRPLGSRPRPDREPHA